MGFARQNGSAHVTVPERISIELTNRCQKACWFCYNHSLPVGETQWNVDDLVRLVLDCRDHGTRAVSFGGGEPLQFEGVFELLRRLDGELFRSMTTNGLLLEQHWDELQDARPDKVHVSIHFPNQPLEVERVIRQVKRFEGTPIRSGVNLLVARSQLDAARVAAEQNRQAGIDNQRIVYLPMRGRDRAGELDTPSPAEVADVAGRRPFQSMTCLSECSKSPRFCSISWDQQVAWCSYTSSRQSLTELTCQGLMQTLLGLPLAYCGNASEESTKITKRTKFELRSAWGSINDQGT